MKIVVRDGIKYNQTEPELIGYTDNGVKIVGTALFPIEYIDEQNN